MDTENNNHKDELNLWDLIVLFFKSIKKYCIYFITAIGKMLQLTFRRIIVVSIITLLGFAAGLYLSRPSARFYEAGAMAWLNGPTSQMVKQVNRQLETAFPKNYAESLSLSSLLGIPDSVALNIRKIESFHVVDFQNDSTPDMIDFKNNHSMEDTLNVISPNYLYFRLQTKKVEQLPIFEKAFLNYLNSNTNIQQLYANYKINQERTQQIHETELQRLDSLEQLTYLQPQEHLKAQLYQSQFLIGEQRTQILFEDIQAVLQTQQRYIPYHALCTAPVVLLDHFAANPTAVNNRPRMCILGICIGYIVGLLIALCIEQRRKILDYLRRK